jgi:hypothetical protein
MSSENLLRNIAERTSSNNKLSEAFSKYHNKIYFSDPLAFVCAIQADIAYKQRVAKAPGNIRFLLAHQPVFFPYEAITINYLLMDSLKKHLGELLNVSVESMHLVLDMDISKEPRFRNVSIPSPLKKDGIVKLTASINMANKYMPMLSMEHDPSVLVVQLRKLIDDLNMENRVLGKLGITKGIETNNFTRVLEQLDGCITNKNLHLSNFYSLSVLANEILRTDTIFQIYSDLINTISNLPGFFGRAIEDLKPAALELITVFNDLGVCIPKSLLNFVDEKYFWGICYRCLSRNDINGQRYEFICKMCGTNNIVRLGDTYTLENRAICPQVVPKVILEEYFLLYVYGCDAFVAYTGGAEHVMVSNMLYTIAGFNSVPTLLWRPHTEFVSPAEILNHHAETDIFHMYTNSHKVNEALMLHSSGRASWLYPLMYMDTSDYKKYWDHYLQKHIWRLI